MKTVSVHIELDEASLKTTAKPLKVDFQSQTEKDSLPHTGTVCDWQFSYSFPTSIKITVGVDSDHWQTDTTLMAFVTLSIDGITQSGSPTRIEIYQWQREKGMNTGTFIISVDATAAKQVQAFDIDGFYDFLRKSPSTDLQPPASPQQFIWSAYNIQNMFMCNNSSFRKPGMLSSQLDTLVNLVGQRNDIYPSLGFNTTAFGEWTLQSAESIPASEVRTKALTNGLKWRSAYTGGAPLGSYQKVVSIMTGQKIGQGEDAVYERWVYSLITVFDFFLRSISAPKLTELVKDNILPFPFNKDTTDWSSSPLPDLKHFVFSEEYSVGDKGALETLRKPTEPLTPIEQGFRQALAELGADLGETLSVDKFRKAFVDYLKDVNPSPAFWGAVSLEDDINPVRSDEGNPWFHRSLSSPSPSSLPLSTRALHLHSIRFLQKEMVKGAIHLARTVDGAIKSLPTSSQQFNLAFNTNSRFGMAAQPYTKYGHQIGVWFDQFDLARSDKKLRHAGDNAITTWWEDNDQVGYGLIFDIGHGELLRSQAMLGLSSLNYDSSKRPQAGQGGEFGLFIRPASGQKQLMQVDEMAYRVFAFLGKGAKTFDFFKFGPTIDVDGWGYYTKRLCEIAKISRMVGKTEKVLFPGRPTRGKIAILVTRCSEIWETHPDYSLYQVERIFLATPFAHAGWRVDYIDEEDLVQGELMNRDYRVLFLTDPNLPKAGVSQIVKWVQAGGSLAVLPGAAIEDEYGEPLGTEIDTLLGVKPRSPAFDPDLTSGKPTFKKEEDPNLDQEANSADYIFIRLTATVQSKGGNTDISSSFVKQHRPKWQFEIDPGAQTNPQRQTKLLAQWMRKDINGEQPITAETSGTVVPALTVSNSGQGKAYCYGFFPGATYLHNTKRSTSSGSTQDSALPIDWKLPARDLILEPVHKLGLAPRAITRFRRTTPRLKFSKKFLPGAISVDILESGTGIALVVMNWERDPTVVRPKATNISNSGWEEIEISLADFDPARFHAPESALGTPVRVSVEPLRLVLRFYLDTVDVITLRAHLPPPDKQTKPPLDFVICDPLTNRIQTVDVNHTRKNVSPQSVNLRDSILAHYKLK